MNPNLLDITSLSPQGQTSRGLTLEDIKVNPELAPFLVSSTRSVAWVPHASKENTVRAAMREREGIESELVAAIITMGNEVEWGNIHALTTEGIQACVEHVKSYIDEPLEILFSSDTDMEGIRLPKDIATTSAQWIPTDCVVVVPVDRTYVGSLWVIGRHKIAALVHNPARGIAVAWR
jgi:hypothetical protein